MDKKNGSVEKGKAKGSELVESSPIGDETLQKPLGDTEATLRKPPESKPDEAPTLQKPPLYDGESTLTLQVADLQNAASGNSDVDPGVGKKFGDYKLLSVIARGGMGVVYKAQQRKLNRICAVKMILAGQFADQTDVDRFYAEAEAAANLRHPNIVGVYEIGEAEGQHFFSMQYIEGESLSEVARENPLEPERAAQYTQKIALAMQFAHDRGILHRDLKPSNVLLDGADQPLITDFGLAKKVDGGSDLTMTGMVVGTPGYMAPEQARGETDKIGKAADVYSTGAILYELITGLPPFRATTPYETIRRVLDSEPVAPRIINPAIPRDLETICLKSLQKDQAARYASEQDLADELDRFLAGEPILARPVGRINRVWRWCKRNPVIASLSAAALTFLIAALVASTIGYVTTSAALKESDESFRQARQTVDDLFIRLSEEQLLNQPGMQPLRQDLLRSALVYYEKFLQQRGDDPTLRDELALTFFRVGLITEQLEAPSQALPFYNRSLVMLNQQLEANPDDPEVLKNVGDVWNALGRVHHNSKKIEEALSAYGKAAEIRQQLAKIRPGESEPLRLWTNSLMNVAIVQREQGEYDEARTTMESAQSLREKQLRSDPSALKLRGDFASGFYNLGVLESSAGNLKIAEDKFLNARGEFERILSEQPEDLATQWQLATCHRLIADSRAARLSTVSKEEAVMLRADTLLSYGEAESLLGRLAIRNPDVIEYRISLAGVEMNVGTLYRDAKDDLNAEQAFEKSFEILSGLFKEQPGMRRVQRDLAIVQMELAVYRALAGNFDGAKVLISDSIGNLSSLISDLPENESNYAPQLKSANAISEWIQTLQEESPGSK